MLKLSSNNQVFNRNTIQSKMPTTANPMSNETGVYRYQQGLVELFPVPRSSTFTVTSTSATGSEDKTFYAFNEDTFNATPTNNGGGAGTIVTTYDDGFDGASLNKLLGSANNGRGLLCRGFTVIYTLVSSGAQDPAGLVASSIQLGAYNSKNAGFVPYPMDISEALRNTQYQSGTITIEADFFVNSLTQVTGVVSPGSKAQIIFLWGGSKI